MAEADDHEEAPAARLTTELKMPFIPSFVKRDLPVEIATC
jgi:hypothetical protein